MKQASKANEKTLYASRDELKKLTMLEATTNLENKEYKDSEGNVAIIPAGFAVSQVEDEKNINTGLVILDSAGNEFVWIPVFIENDYQRNYSYPSSYESLLNNTPSDSTYTDLSYLPEGIQPESNDSTSNELAEKKAILKYHGFYISRYEAGNDNNNLVSKKFASVWININSTDAKRISKTFINTNKVKSALCSGIQWDIVMNFVDGKKDGNNNTFNVRISNNYRHTGQLLNAGCNEGDKVQNIYDLEGNCSEWVAERSNVVAKEPFVNRGGYFDMNYGTPMASGRNSNGDIQYNRKSFRIVLYII